MAKKIERNSMTQTDSKGKVIRAPRDNSSGASTNYRWWKLEENEMAPAIAATIKFIKQHQSQRLAQLVASTRLYGSSLNYGLMGSSFNRANSVSGSPQTQRVTYNICSSIVDTLTSKISKNKVVPTYITNGGDWNVQKKAKELTKFTQGLFYQEKVHQKMVHGFRDAAVWADGLVKIFRKEDKVCIERAMPHDILVDNIEAIVSDVTQMHQTKFVDRDIAKELFPELEESIDNTMALDYQEMGGHGTTADLVCVNESWHLRSGKDADDGVHVISIGEGAMADEWDKDYFPFAKLAYSQRVLGYWSQGACERLQNIQAEINRNMILKQRSLWMQGSFKILLENGSKIVSQHLNNEIGAIVHYSGTQPSYIVPPATNPEIQEWIDSLIEKGYRQEGVSQLSASAIKPMGVNSGKAMRTLTDTEDDRFLSVEQDFEAFALEIAKQAINVVKDIYEDKKSYEVVFPNTKFVETINWKDVQLDEEQYVLKAYPTSSLSTDLTGRLSEIQEMMQAGLVSPRTGKRLMDMPDVEMNESLTNAPEDRLHQIFETMLEDGEYTSPQPPFHDLQLAKQLLLDYYNYAEYMKVPQDRISLLEQFNIELNDAMGALTPPAPLAAQAGAAPQAAPMPQPQSNMVQNQPGVMQ